MLKKITNNKTVKMAVPILVAVGAIHVGLVQTMNYDVPMQLAKLVKFEMLEQILKIAIGAAGVLFGLSLFKK